MYSKKEMWSELHLLVDTAVMVCDHEERCAKTRRSNIIFVDSESTKKLFTRRLYSQQHSDNLNVSSSISEKTKTKDPPNTNDDKSSSPSSCLTEIPSRTRRAQNQRSSKTGFKKAKIGTLPFVERKIPNWVFQVMEKINSDSENPRMVFERTLTESDVKSSQSRLLIPFSMLMNNDFLTPEEARAINKEENNSREDENVGVGTIVVNDRGQMWGLRLKIWSMEKKSGKGTLNYALNWGWNDVVEGNNLKAEDKIGLWIFRCRGVLCFALDVLERS